MLIIHPNPIPKLQHAFLPPKCYELRNVPELLTLPLFHLGLTLESIKELGSSSMDFSSDTRWMIIVHKRCYGFLLHIKHVLCCNLNINFTRKCEIQMPMRPKVCLDVKHTLTNGGECKG